VDDNEDSHTTSRLGVARIISALTASTSLCCSDFHFLSSLALLPTDVVCTFTRTGMLASRAHRPMFVSKHEALRPVLSTQVDRARNARTWSVAHCSFHSRQTMSPKRLSADGAIAFIVTSTIARDPTDAPQRASIKLRWVRSASSSAALLSLLNL
jgi:hypothetical protein